jgi:hypothetical protein
MGELAFASSFNLAIALLRRLPSAMTVEAEKKEMKGQAFIVAASMVLG